jgi:gliding motility-associated-like protein
MYKIFTSMVAICCCLLLAQTSTAQVSFSVVPTEQQADIQVGDTVTINIEVDGFTGIVSYQFSINWNASFLDFESIHSLGLPNMSLGGNFGTNNAGNGIITTLWDAPMGNPYSLPGGSGTIFSFDMIVLTPAGISAPISITSNPTVLEVIGLNGSGQVDDITSTVIINNGTATIAPPGGGGPSCNFGGDFGHILESGSGGTGTEVCLSVFACGFTDIESMQYSINFNPAHLQFNNAENYNLPGLNNDSFNGNNTSGFITLSWDLQGGTTTVADGTALYDICFTLVGAGGTSTPVTFSNNPLPIQVTDASSNGQHIGFESVPGTVTITGNSSSAVTVIASAETGTPGNQACVEISVLNWDSVIAFQYSMHWDPSIIQFASLQNLAGDLLPSDFNTSPSLTNAGTLTVGYADTSTPTAGFPLANGGTLYDVCFNIIGDIGDVSPFTFNGTPTVIDVTQIVNGVVVENVPLVTQAGSVTVTNPGNNNDLVITASTEEACTGDTVCVAYVADNFNSLISMEFTMTFDQTKLLYLPALTDNAVPQLDAMDFNLISPGNLKMIWVEPGLNPITLPLQTTIINVCFEVTGADGTSSVMGYNDNQTQEIGDPNGPVAFSLVDGIANIICLDNCPQTPTATITNVNCFGGNTGAINITVANALPSFTYAWSGPGVNPTSEDQTGLAAGTYSVTVTNPAEMCSASASFTVTQPTAALNVTIASTPATCDNGTNGTATATPTGGTGPYTYLWSNGGATTQTIMNLPAGQRCVTVTDSNGCTDSECVTITDGSPINISFTKTNSACSLPTGSLTASASGIPGAFTYAWNTGASGPTINNLAPGQYCVTVTASNGCTESECENIGTLNGPNLQISTTQTTCSTSANGTATVTASGGTMPYTYLWNDPAPAQTTATATDLAAGSYTVTVTDNGGCSTVMSGTVSAGNGISANASVTSAITCNGANNGAVSVTASGGAGVLTYNWSNGNTGPNITGLIAGTYTVTISDSGSNCTETESVTLTQPSGISLTLTPTSESSGNDGAVSTSVSGGTPGYTYLWSNGATTPNLSNLMGGQYCVTVTDTNGCTKSGCTTVNGLNALQVSLLTSVPESCFNSNNGLLAVLHNGSGPFSYSWSDGTMIVSTTNPATGLGADSYSVTVTDSNMTSGVLSNIVLAGPTSDITYSVDKTDVGCFGGTTGSIGLSISGGNGAPYTVSWSSGHTGSVITNLPAGSYTPTITDSNGCTKAGTAIVVAQPTSMNITLVSQTNPGCNGELTGEIHISVTGGTGPYTYQWFNPNPMNINSPNLTGLPSGNYSCIVIDANGCMATTGQITLEVVSSPQITAVNVSDLDCNGDMSGAISLTVTGGDNDYTFDWAHIVGTDNPQNLTGLSVGDYFVTVTDGNGCTDIAGPVTIAQPAPISLSIANITPASATVDDGAVDINNPTGGTSPYTYQWSNGATTQDISMLAAGTYTLTVTDSNGCIATISVVVPGSLSVNAAITNISCAGAADGAINVSIFGGEPFPAPVNDYQYLWNYPVPNATTQDLNNLPPGEYCVTVTDANGLTTSDCFTVTQPNLLVISNFNVINETGNGCNGSINITVAGGTPEYDYQWSNGATSEDLSNLCKGTYTVSIVDANGCMLISPPITVLPTPMTVVSTTVSPTTCADSEDGEYCISVFGGCEPYNFTLSTGAMMNSITGQNVCFSDLAAGNYMLTISDSDGSTTTPDIVQSFTITSPAPIVITINNQNDNTGGINCNGTINIDVTGAVGSPTYVWSNGFNGQDPSMLCGNGSPYSVIVTDGNQCTATLGGIVINDAPFVEGESSDVSCSDACDGSINTTVTFGDSPYTYLWSNAQTTPDLVTICPGEYTVTVTDASGISTVETFNVYGPAQPLAVTTVSTSSENGDNIDGAINIGVTGGWGGYTYQWSNGATSMDVAGLEGDMTYFVTVTDANGCEFIHSQYVGLNDIFLTGSEVEEEQCAGIADGFICITTEGGTLPHTYLWNVNGQNNDPCIYALEPGTYQVTVTDATGIISKVFTFELNGQEPISITFSTATSSATAIPSGGIEPYEFQWNNVALDNTATIIDQPTNTYFVVVTDANGCTATESVDITGPLGNDCEEANTILSPNGDNANEIFEILCSRLYDIDLVVYNRWGQKVYEATDYQNDWTGLDSDGNPLPEDGYFYIVSFQDPDDGSDRQIKGYLTILLEDE